MDLDAKLSFAYVMNKMVSTLTGDPVLSDLITQYIHLYSIDKYLKIIF